MSVQCRLTGAVPRFGTTTSRSRRRTSRRFSSDIQRKTPYAPLLVEKVTLRLIPRAIKTIDRIDIDAAITRTRARGEKV